jgi:hypothetical protein
MMLSDKGKQAIEKKVLRENKLRREERRSKGERRSQEEEGDNSRLFSLFIKSCLLQYKIMFK